jgi:hypothetical protein
MLQPDQAEAQPTKAPLKVTQTVRPRVVSARRRKINGIKRSARRMACNGVLESAFLARERAACHTTADRLPATPRSHLRLRFALSVATAAANPSGRGSFAACRVARRLLACAPPRPVSPAQSVPAQMWQGRAQPVPAQSVCTLSARSEHACASYSVHTVHGARIACLSHCGPWAAVLSGLLTREGARLVSAVCYGDAVATQCASPTRCAACDARVPSAPVAAPARAAVVVSSSASTASEAPTVLAGHTLAEPPRPLETPERLVRSTLEYRLTALSTPEYR